MTKYLIIVALGAISYGTLASFAKIAYGQGYTAGEITFAQAFIGTIILWSVVLFRSIKKKSFQLTGNWKLIAAGTSMGLSAYCYYLSVKYIPVSLAIVLLMQVSWISNLAEWIVFKKKLSTLQITASVIIVTGTVLAGNLLKTADLSFSFTGIALALSAAVLYTIYVLFTSRLGTEIPLFEKSALMTTGSAMMILLINFKSITTSTHFDLGLLKWGTFLAVFGTVIPPVCFTIGMPKIGAGLSSILLTLELPAVVFCAHIILGEQITFLQIIGITIMIGAIIWLNLVKQKKQTPKNLIS